MIEGLQRAVGCWKSDLPVIFTVSVSFCDKLIVALLHAGYTAHFQLHGEKGVVLAYNDKNRNVICPWIYETLNDYEKSKLSCIQRQHDYWRVSYTNNHYGTKPAMARNSCMSKEIYNGRMWGVKVDHPDHLIITQRAFLKAVL